MSSKSLPTFGEKLKLFSYSNETANTPKKIKVNNEQNCLEQSEFTTTPTIVADTNTDLKPPFPSSKNGASKPPGITKPKSSKRVQQKKDSSKRNKYAGPEKYAHLSPLTPLLIPGLLCVFVGFNPGIETAVQGHYYAHCSNLFWKLIYESGCVDRKVSFRDDVKLPQEYLYGFHDLLPRPTKGIEELSQDEMLEAVPQLEARLEPHTPAIICIVGKGIWEKIYRFKTQKPLNQKEFEWGIQYRPKEEYEEEQEVNSARNLPPDFTQNLNALPFTFAGGDSVIYVLPSTSGLVTSPSRQKKLELWQNLAKEIEFQRERRISKKKDDITWPKIKLESVDEIDKMFST